MFSTFTGSSRRPRNVNLSGQAGNPFANTSWSPSVVSSATKTVSDAQAEREKRQVERQRLRAAGNIQKVWRGCTTRRALAKNQRAAFDGLYLSATSTSPSQRLPIAFNLLLAFFSARCADDVQRALLFARDADSVDLEHIAPANAHASRLKRLLTILVKSLDVISSSSDKPHELEQLLRLIIRVTSTLPYAIAESADQYFQALARLCRSGDAGPWKNSLPDALTAPLKVASAAGEPQRSSVNPCYRPQQGCRAAESCIYRALTFGFLAQSDIVQFEENIALFSGGIDADKLIEAIRTGYAGSPEGLAPKDGLLWLLAHYIDLGRLWIDPSDKLAHLSALLPQLSFLSPEISVRLGTRPGADASSNGTEDSVADPLHPYVSRLLLSLLDRRSISRLLRDFSDSLAQTSNHELQDTSALAGYILTLFQCFPAAADDTRMRLFLEQIPAASGRIPTVKFLWQIMKQTSVFHKLVTEAEQPSTVLRRYLHGISQLLSETTEEQEWRIMLLFLELYIFILRLSDDEDFFSGMGAYVLESNSSTSRLQSSSLSLEDVKALTVFLKNTAFTLHYKANEISQTPLAVESATKSRLDSYLGADGSPSTASANTGSSSAPVTKVDLDGLRAILTTALKMLYVRDSRMHFLPPDHWLMTSKLEQEDFINAVIAEEERQHKEEAEESDSEADSAAHGYDAETGVYSTVAGQRLSRHARLERLRAQQMRAQRERRLAEMGPKLEVLKHMPFVVPFETRVKIFRQFIQLDKARRGTDTSFFPLFPPHPSARHHARIRRGRLFQDAFEQFYEIGEGLKDPIQITFVDQFDNPEAGIDGGGVTKEFLLGVTAEAFGPNSGGENMFTSNKQGLLFPDPTAADVMREELRRWGLTEDKEEWALAMGTLFERFEFLGRVVGKCLYEGILIDLAFAGFFLLKWPSSGPREENAYKGSINDLRDMDEELYKGMLRLKNYAGDVSDLGFDFTVEDQVSPRGNPIKTVTRRLIPDGDRTSVTNDNRLLYISYLARHRLVIQPYPQTAAFLRGLRAIIRPSWLSMFNQSELQRLVGGDSTEIDIGDLRRNTVYSGLYEMGDAMEEHPTIKLFWKVMEGFTDAQRRDVLKYVSSTPRAPLLGFSQLRPKFSIRDGGTDQDRLPSTSTCVNLLKLPQYRREETLREKLLYAVTSGAGFDLS